MPSHVTHGLFALDTYRRAFHSDPDPAVEPWLILGASGPDFFFSGIGRRPAGQEWGFRFHAEGFGRAAAVLAAGAAESAAGHPDAAALRAYALAFGGHAVLDRAVHPLVNYFSGWVDPNMPDSRRYLFCHPFLERIIDMIMLRDACGTDMESYAFPSRIPSPEEQEALLTPLYVRVIREAYPGGSAGGETEAAIRNALRDNADFLRLCDPSVPEGGAREAAEAEKRGELPERILGLFYPEAVPAGDFMNEDGAGWRDPRRGGEKRRESFMDLYHEAAAVASRLMRTTADVIGGKTPPEVVEAELGNGDLNDPLPGGPEQSFRYSDPLEIPPLIDGMYAALQD